MSGSAAAVAASGRHLVVVYPPGLGHYVDREFLGLVPGTRTTFVVPDDAFARGCRAPIRFVRATYRTWWPRRVDFGMATTEVVDLSGVLDALRPSVVVTYELHSSLTRAVARFARARDLPHVVLSYEVSAPSSSGWGVFPPTRWAARSAGRSAARVVAHTERARRVALDLGIPAEKLRRLYPGVYLPATVPDRSTDHRPRFGYLGGLRPNKGLGTLLRALGTFGGRADRVPFQFVIGGAGPMESEVRRAVAGAPFVEYAGWVPNDEKPRFLAGLDVLVYPSSETRVLGLARWEEQTATAVLEAFGAGVPAVGTTSGALPEIIGDAGWVVPRDDPVELAACLARLASAPEERRAKSAAARRRAERWFDIRRVGVDFGQILDELPVPPTGGRP